MDLNDPKLNQSCVPLVHQGLRTTDLLLAAVRGQDERVTIAEILDALDARAFGLATLMFAIPSIVPMPPGIPTVVGVCLLIVSVQMVIGRQELWLPKILSERGFSRTALISGLEKVRPTLSAAEKLSGPRLLFMTGRIGTVVIGLIVLIMAIVLILPLPPGGNFPPALACAVLGLGLAERDGLIVMIGLAVSIAATVAVWFVTALFIESLPQLWQWVTGLFG